MSVRDLYNIIPVERRFCHFCGNTILRNIDVIVDKDGGRVICHHGCINKYGYKAVARCLNCYAVLRASNVVKTDFGDGHFTSTCGCCGSPQLSWFRKRKRSHDEDGRLPRGG